MAKMRATLRKVAQVTPPPSPKNGDDVKSHSEWSTRLRNHSIPAVVKVAKGRRAKIVRIKKENPVFHPNGDFNCSRSSTPSPVCDASRIRMRHTSGEGLNYWPRRSARLIGIPAEEIDDQHNKSNGSIEIDQEGNKEDSEEEEGGSVGDTNHDNERLAPEEPTNQCKNCKQQTNKQQTKGRTLEALLVESQRFMHYPSGRGSGTCRNGRSTFNSRDFRPPSQTCPRIATVCEETDQQHEAAPTPLPMIRDRLTVDQVQFSFEIVPSGTSWYQTFLRDEEFHRDSGSSLPDDPPIGPAPFLLPYEMSLETILKSNRAVRKNNISRGRGRGAKKAVPLSFRPIISTRLQMQSAARQSQLAAAASSSAKASALSKIDGRCLRHNRRKPWFNMPRKSPRCHASTMAILCSQSDTESDAVPNRTTTAGTTTTKTAAAAEESQSAQEEVKKTSVTPAPDSYLMQVLEEMLTQGLEKRPANPVRKRGRPRKRPLPIDEQCPPPTELVESSIAHLLATPLERIEDFVDERMVLPDAGDHCMFNDNDPPYPPYCWTLDQRRDDPSLVTGLDHVSEMFPDLDSHSGSRSSSVYETASEMGSTSTSTGTCDSRRKVWRNAGVHSLRRKRRCNMTGWPRSKKRRPLQLSVINVDDDLNLTGNLSCDGDDDDDDDEGPPNIILSPIREESSLLVDGISPDPSQQQPSPRSSSSGANKSFASKPFQFQRKTLRFVGKRILRPAAQRHAPQRLEYWPCFPTESSSCRRRKRKT